MHWAAASKRSTDLLGHDEAISLLIAAGKAERIDRLYAEEPPVKIIPAGELQDLLRPTPEVKTQDVVRSLSQLDIHPPLYFVILHGLQALGVCGHTPLRLFGILMLLVGAWAARRWVWPDASLAALLLGTAWLWLSPVSLQLATELRQYALIYLGAILSFAALVMLWERRQPDRHTMMLLVLAPVLLLWSQYGTAVWIGLCLLAAIVYVISVDRQRWRLVTLAVGMAFILLLPLILWGLQILAARQTLPTWPSQGFLAGVLLPLCNSLTEAWCSLPWPLRRTPLPPIIVVVLLILTAAVAWRNKTIDRVLWCAGIAWGMVWLLLVATGRLPPHCMEPKYLAPLVLMPLCVLVRAISLQGPRWRSRTAMAALACSLVSHALGDWRLLAKPPDETVLTALIRTEAMLVNAPKRGHLLPLAARMEPGAKVIVAAHGAALADWPDIAAALPSESLILVEIDVFAAGQRSPQAEELYQRLKACYHETRLLRQGPNRVVTEFVMRKV